MLQKTLDYILESWLPTKSTILIAGSSISLTLLSIGLPEFLQKMGLQLQSEKILLLRIVVPLTLLNLGTFAVLLMTLKYLKALKKDKTESENLIIEQLQQENNELKDQIYSKAKSITSKSRPSGIV